MHLIVPVNYDLYYDNVLIHSGEQSDIEESIYFGSGDYSCSPTPAPSGVDCSQQGTQKFVFEIQQVVHPNAVKWSLINDDNKNHIASGDGFDDHVILCLDKNSIYEFKINDSFGSEMWCSNNQNAQYKFHFNENLVHSWGCNQTGIITFGHAEERLSLGLLGVFLDDPQLQKIENQVAYDLRWYSEGYLNHHIDDASVSVLNLSFEREIRDGVQNYSGREKMMGSGLLVDLKINAQYHLYSGYHSDYYGDDHYIDDDHYSYYSDHENLTFGEDIRYFFDEWDWYDYVNSWGDSTNIPDNDVVTRLIVIGGAIVGSIITLCLALNLVTKRNKGDDLLEVVEDGDDDEISEDYESNHEMENDDREIEEEKVEEGDTANAASNSAVYDLGRADYLINDEVKQET